MRQLVRIPIRLKRMIIIITTFNRLAGNLRDPEKVHMDQIMLTLNILLPLKLGGVSYICLENGAPIGILQLSCKLPLVLRTSVTMLRL